MVLEKKPFCRDFHKVQALLAFIFLGFGAITTTVSALTFTVNLKQGSKGADVKNLQSILNMSADTQVAVLGKGSPGKETTTFGPATYAAVIRFQNKYASSILAPIGLTKGTGLVDELTRARLNTIQDEFGKQALKIEAVPEQKQAGSFLGTEVPQAIQSVGLPARLKIPKINVDADFVYVGLTSKGVMDSPKGPLEVAWFKSGSRPGEIGSAVIAGHFGWKEGKKAAFDNLQELRKGDKLQVEDEKGRVITFVVRELRSYGEHDNASDVFVSSDGKAHLNLVTCEGVWNKKQKSYSKRLVVFTDRL